MMGKCVKLEHKRAKSDTASIVRDPHIVDQNFVFNKELNEQSKRKSSKEKRSSKKFWKKTSDGNMNVSQNSLTSSSKELIFADQMIHGTDVIDSSLMSKDESFTDIAEKMRFLMDSNQKSKSSEILNNAFNSTDSYKYGYDDESDGNISTSASSSMNSIVLDNVHLTSPLHSKTSSVSLPNSLDVDVEGGSGTLVSKITRDDCVTMVLQNMEEKLLPASQGATLRTALECLHQDVRGVQVDAPGTRGRPLSLDTELKILRGTRLCIRPRASSIDAAIECSEEYFRRRESIDSQCGQDLEANDDIFSQEFSEETLKRSKKRKGSEATSVFYSPIELPAMEQLEQLLNHYNRNGIPHLPHILNFQPREELHESRWQDLVTSWEQLDPVHVQQQNAIWEFVQSEDEYIRMLKVCQELFIACLCNLQNESLMFETDTEKLFGNIQEVYSSNVTFWQDYILKMLEKSRDTGEPLDPTILAEAFKNCDELFAAYLQHSLEQSRCQFYCKKSSYNNELFTTYLTWCESQPMCERNCLSDMLVAPMSRLSKYTILLTAIVVRTNQPEQQTVLHDMICTMDGFLSQVKIALNDQYEQQRLREISNKIETCDIVGVRDDELEGVVRKHSSLDLNGPMPGCAEHLSRHLIHRGELKIKDIQTSKLDVQIILFTDMMLVTKSMQKKSEKVKIIRPPYHIEYFEVVDVKDSLSIGIVYVNEWRVAEYSFIIQCPDQNGHKTWLEMIQRAKDLYNEAKMFKFKRRPSELISLPVAAALH